MTDMETGAAVDVQDVPEEPRAKPGGLVTLQMRPTHPDHGREDNNRNLDYGPASARSAEHGTANIKFNDYMSVTRADHPLLDEVLRKYPVDIVTTESKTEVFIDAETGKEYKSKRAYNSAQRAKKAARKQQG